MALGIQLGDQAAQGVPHQNHATFDRRAAHEVVQFAEVTFDVRWGTGRTATQPGPVVTDQPSERCDPAPDRQPGIGAVTGAVDDDHGGTSAAIGLPVTSNLVPVDIDKLSGPSQRTISSTRPGLIPGTRRGR